MSAHTIPVAVLRLGRIVATPNAIESLSQEDVLIGIQRHQAGDWGDLESEDRQANDRALSHGGRILLRLSRSQRHQVLDHHRSGSVRNDDPAPGRLLKQRPLDSRALPFLPLSSDPLLLENKMPSAPPARVTQPEATRFSGWTAERE